MVDLATELLREKFAEMKDGHIRVAVVMIEHGKKTTRIFSRKILFVSRARKIGFER